MSKKVPEEQYRQTFSYKFSQWLEGNESVPEEEASMDKDGSSTCKEIQKPDRETIADIREEQYVIQKQMRQKEKEQMKLTEQIYDMEHNTEIRIFRKVYRIFSALFCVFLVVMLLTAVSALPDFGNEDNPVNNEVAARYIEKGLQETGAVNIVTGMILDYRAFDTLGESHVLFIATCTVLILLKNDKKEKEMNDRTHEPKNDVILQTVARILVPPIFIFGIYLILAGHLGPGGGFSGGAVIGAGMILYLNAFGFAKTEKFFTAKTYRRISFCALACYSIAKSYSFYTGANHIESVIPLGTPGAIFSSGLILLLNICVGTVVAGTMYTFYVMFRKGDY